MAEKIFLHLLFLCVIWSQGIIGTFADEEIKQSPDFLDRQKRVVSYLPNEDVPTRIHNVPYVVRIKENGQTKCVGNILSEYVVITSASCTSLPPQHYGLVSNSANIKSGTDHSVTEIRKRISNPHNRSFDGVTLLIVNPRFVYSSFCEPINLHIGAVPTGAIGRVAGWGYNPRTRNYGTSIPLKLRQIEVPVISNQNCTNVYSPHFEITEKNVCTYHPDRHSGHTDSGAGLVVGGTLAGVLLWNGLPIANTNTRYPDVYANLHDAYYNQWIRLNIETINTFFRNQH